MKIVNVAKVVVENGDGDILLLRRSKTDPRRAGEWDFPGGNVDADESHLDAAIRETEEEAGIVITDPAILYVATEKYEPKEESVNRALCYARVQNGVAVTLSYEHDEFKWVSKRQALIDFPHPFYSVGLKYALDNELI